MNIVRTEETMRSRVKRGGMSAWLSIVFLLAQGAAAQAQSKQHVLPLVMSGTDPALAGFVRIINHSDRAGTVRIQAIDDSGARAVPIVLSLGAKRTVHFDSTDLEQGNASKGLATGVGDGEGNWRLELDTALDIEPLAYVRTADGFLTSMHDVVVDAGSMRYRVPFFNPARSASQRSHLRLINPGDKSVKVSIDGVDDMGAPPDAEVTLSLGARSARTISAQELESGGSGLSGAFGAGSGRWQLIVSADQPIQVMNLLIGPTRHLTNLSTSTSARDADRTQAPQPGAKLRDCDTCPELVVVPAGTYRMGSPAWEVGRQTREGPVHEVQIVHRFAVGVHEVTRGEFAEFVADTGYSTGDACSTYENGEWQSRRGRTWRGPGFSQTDSHPVVCVSWSDAKAYAAWLGRKTGQAYRLPSESEWEYVARAGTRTARHWGESETSQCLYANGRDQAFVRRYGDFDAVACNDGHAATAPVGSYRANAFGLHDVAGNVWEWVEDCWHESYAGAPAYGEAWETGNCQYRMRRGGSWTLEPRFLRSAQRGTSESPVRGFWGGFRVARTIPPRSSPGLRPCDVVDIPDASLRTAVERALGKTAGSPIRSADMTRLDRLEAGNRAIQRLTGLECATGLTRLGVTDNRISNLTPLAGLTALTVLEADANRISDLTPLAGLTALTTLSLRDNQISDISALASNAGLGGGDRLDLRANPLSPESLSTHVPALQARGATVSVSSGRTETARVYSACPKDPPTGPLPQPQPSGCVCSSATRVVRPGSPPAPDLSVGIGGKVVAHEPVSSVRVIGYYGGVRVGDQLLGSMATFESKDFSISGYIYAAHATGRDCTTSLEVQR